MPAYTKKKKGEENKGGKEEEEDVIKDKDDDDDDISDKAELKINSDVSLTHLQQTLSHILFPTDPPLLFFLPFLIFLSLPFLTFFFTTNTLSSYLPLPSSLSVSILKTQCNEETVCK